MRMLSRFGIYSMLSAIPAAAAADGELRASYTITFAGLSLANATLDVAVRGGAYTTRVAYQTAGASRLVADAAGLARSNGAYKGRQFIPASFDLEYRNGRRTQNVVLGIAEGNIKTMTVDPPLKLTSGQFPIEPEHLTAIADPLSALLRPAVSADGKTQVGPCDRTLSVLDGLRRYNVRLEPKGTGTTEQKGFSESTTVCRVVLKPLAGSIGGADARAASANADQIDVTFGRVHVLDLHLPISLQARTQYGAVRVTLTGFTDDASKLGAAPPSQSTR